jgi:hypothetical protein
MKKAVGNMRTNYKIDLGVYLSNWIACMAVMQDEQRSVFICYAHSDNESSNRNERWLDSLLGVLQPFVRRQNLSV